jgi:hypothetical protein
LRIDRHERRRRRQPPDSAAAPREESDVATKRVKFGDWGRRLTGRAGLRDESLGKRTSRPGPGALRTSRQNIPREQPQRSRARLQQKIAPIHGKQINSGFLSSTSSFQNPVTFPAARGIPFYQ